MSTVVQAPAEGLRRLSAALQAGGTPLFTLAVTLVAAAWFSTTGYRQDLAILTAVYALLALGMYVPFILGNRLSLAYNAYLGVGAYAVGMVGTRTDLPLLLAVPVGMLVSAALAVEIGRAHV